MEQRLTIVGLGVNDLQTSSAFYEGTFGWERLPSSNESIVFMQLDGILLSLYAREELAKDAGVSSSGSGFKGFSLAHNTRSHEEVDELFTMFESKGVEIVKPPEEVFWGGYSGYIANPDGNLWEIAHNPFLALDEKGDVV